MKKDAAQLPLYLLSSSWTWSYDKQRTNIVFKKVCHDRYSREEITVIDSYVAYLSEFLAYFSSLGSFASLRYTHGQI